MLEHLAHPLTNKKSPILQAPSRRFRLRGLKTSDRPDIVGWFEDAEVLSFAFGRPHPGQHLVELGQTYLEDLFQNRRQVLVIESVSEAERLQLMGFVRYSLYPKTWTSRIFASKRWARIGIMIGLRRAWGKGIGSEAISMLVDFLFEQKKVFRIDLDTATFNQRAQKCFEKVGFQVYQIEGEPQSNYGQVFMEITQEEWLANRSLPSQLCFSS